MKQARGIASLRQWRIFAIMLTGRSYTLADFDRVMSEFGCNVKTIRRDLELLSMVPLFNIQMRTYEGETFYRMMGKPVPDRQYVPLTKYCPDCKKRIALELFGTDRRSIDGKSYYCREHRNQRKRDWVASNQEYIKKYRKNRYQTIEKPAILRERQ